MINNFDYVEHDGIKYSVTHKSGNPFCYASATIKGLRIDGRGTDAQTAFWSLEQKIYQTFDWKLEPVVDETMERHKSSDIVEYASDDKEVKSDGV